MVKMPRRRNPTRKRQRCASNARAARTSIRACLERWLRTKNTCPTCRYELPYEEEPELTIEVEDEENEAQRLADGEVAATAAAREAAVR